MKSKLLLINKAIFPYLSWEFLMVTINLQIYFFKELFLNPNKDGDETQYFVILRDNQVFSCSFISSIIAQPYYFLGVVGQNGVCKRKF